MNEMDQVIQQTKQWGLQTVMHVLAAQLGDLNQSPVAKEKIEHCQAKAGTVIADIAAEVQLLANQGQSPAATIELFVRKVLNWVVENYQKR